MSTFENKLIPRSEAWKYSNTFGTNGDDFYAKLTMNDDGTIAKESYSKAYRKQQQKYKLQSSKEETRNNKKKEKNGEGCLAKILKAPFRLLWWLLKKLLGLLPVIITLGIINSDEKNSDKKK